MWTDVGAEPFSLTINCLELLQKVGFDRGPIGAVRDPGMRHFMLSNQCPGFRDSGFPLERSSTATMGFTPANDYFLSAHPVVRQGQRQFK